MSWPVADMKLAMGRLVAASAEAEVAQEVLRAGPWEVRVVRVAAGAQSEHVAAGACVVLALGGVGSLMVDDWRGTWVPGQLVSVAEGQRVVFVADGPEAVFAALLLLAEGVEGDTSEPAADAT